MKLTSETLTELADLGLNGEQLAAVIRVLAKALKEDEDRKAAQADRKRKSRARHVTVTGQDSDGHCDMAVTVPSPLVPPSLPPEPSIPPPYNPPSLVLVAPAASGDEPKRNDVSSKPKSGMRLPLEWMPSPEDCDVGYDLGLTEDEIRHEHKKFTDYWRGVSGQRGRKLDWNATFRNWLRKAADDKRNRSLTRQPQQAARR